MHLIYVFVYMQLLGFDLSIMILQRKGKVLIVIWNTAAKCFSTIRIDKNLYLMSNDKPKINLKQQKVNIDNSKTLVVMPTWLMARDKHIGRYTKLYLDYGFDVLNVRLKLWQLLWPVKGAQAVASNVLKFIETNEIYSPLILHGFSVGGYLWGEVLVKMDADKKRYQSIINRVHGQIWDSLVDISQMPVGAPKATFPNNKFLENALRFYIIFHMKAFDRIATCHYRRSKSLFFDNLIRTPILVFGSKADPIASEESVQMLREYWENNGLKVYWRYWDDSPHVGHMFKYPKEYIEVIIKYLQDIKARPEKLP